MYVYQALWDNDRDQFIDATKKEVHAHLDRGNFEVVHKSNIPKWTPILSYVYAMKRKRRISTCKVYKWSERMNIHDGKQQYGVNYWLTYATVVTWTETWLILILSIMMGWHTNQIDLLLAYPQDPIDSLVP